MMLALGTVQFGLSYGITNVVGQTTPDEVARIFAVARDAGIELIDTAAAYGEAELVLGRTLEQGAPFRIVTKTIPLPSEDQTGVAAVVGGFRCSLQRLNASLVHGLLVHRYEDLAGKAGPALFAALERCRDAGLVERLGVSVYSPEEALVLAKHYPIDIVQLPLNVLDQRSAGSGALRQLKDRSIDVHARSIFLQGALLDAERTVGRRIAGLAGPLAGFADFAKVYGLTPIEAAIAFVQSQPIAAAVVGVTSASELQDIARIWSRDVDHTALPWDQLAVTDLDLIDPRRWRQ